MPSRARRILAAGLVAHFAEPFAPRALVGWAVGLGLVPTLLLRLHVLIPSPWLPAKVLGVMLLSAFGGLAAAACVWQWQLEGLVVRQFAVRHRRAVRIAQAVVGVGAVLLAVAGAMALGWSGEPAGAVGAAAAKAVSACALGTGTALLMLGRVLTGTRRTAIRRGSLLLGCLGFSAAYLLFFEHQQLGEGLVVLTVTLVGLVMISTLNGPGADSPAVRGVVLGGEVPMALLFLDGTSGGEAARLVAQAVIAVAVGAATVVCAVRFAYWHGRLLRFGTAAAIVPLAYVMFLWFDGQLLGGPLEAPLFVPMAWLAVRLWRRMLDSERITVSAAADIVFAVLLGAILVVFLVWLADLLDLSPVEVTALRGAAAHLGTLIDLPWWQWASVDAVLMAAFLAAALGRRQFRWITEGLGRFRPSGGLDALRRALSVLKTVLLSLMFLGSAGPPAVGPVLSHTLQEHYTADLQRDLEARGKAALYQEIAQQFTRSPQALPVLAQVLLQVHDSTARTFEGDRQGVGEGDLAHLMGELQAQSLLPRFLTPDENSAAGEPPSVAAVHDAGMDGTAADAADFLGRITREQNEAADARAREQAQEHAAEHAAAVVTGALGNFTFGRGIVIGLVREYLDGLAESGLGAAFLRGADRILPGPAPGPPPTAAQVVEPVPQDLQEEADRLLTDELGSRGIMTDPGRARADRESPVAAAVDLAARTIGLRHGTEPCAGCGHFVEPGGGGPGREGEPRIHVE